MDKRKSIGDLYKQMVKNAEKNMHNIDPENAGTTADFDELYVTSDLRDRNVTLLFTENIAAKMTPRQAKRLSRALRRHVERVEEDA